MNDVQNQHRCAVKKGKTRKAQAMPNNEMDYFPRKKSKRYVLLLYFFPYFCISFHNDKLGEHFYRQEWRMEKYGIMTHKVKLHNTP